MNKKVLYIGSFPPPYGGVTIKNDLICNFLRKDYEVVSCKKKGIFSLFFFFIKSYFCSKFIFGIGSNKKLFRIIKLYSFLHLFKIKQSIVVVMGGSFSDELLKNPRMAQRFKRVKALLVETSQMKERLIENKFKNVFVFPNCRLSPLHRLNPSKNNRLKCLYYSKICIEKGADLALDLASIHQDVSFDFWGEIESAFKEEFTKAIEKRNNCKYCGVFSKHDDDLYLFLNKYDLLIFPSLWKHEGVSGALIEAKIAGLPSIVTNWKYNPEIVNDHIDGLVVKTNDLAGFSESLSMIKDDQFLLAELKKNSLANGKAYYIESYKRLFEELIGD